MTKVEFKIFLAQNSKDLFPLISYLFSNHSGNDDIIPGLVDSFRIGRKLPDPACTR